jgi:hypothetical protein
LTRSLGTVTGSTRDDQRRLGACLGIVVGLVVCYFVAHLVWTTDEPGQILWVGPVGVALEWTWWAGIGVAVRALTAVARSSYKPVDTPHLPAGRWVTLLIVFLTALFVLLLSGLRVTGRIDASAAILVCSFDTSLNEILVLIAFGLGFFHLVVVTCVSLMAHNVWQAIRQLPGGVRDFWPGVRNKW